MYSRESIEPRMKSWETPALTESVPAAEAPRYPSMEHLSNDHEDCLSQHENNYGSCMMKKALSLKESQWKLWQQYD